MKLLLTVAAILLAIVCFSQAGLNLKWIRLSKKEYTIQLPSSWTIDSSKQMGTDLILFSMLENATDNFRENVNVLIQHVQGMNMDLDKYTAISTGQIKKMAVDSKIELSVRIKIATATYQKMIYTATQGVNKLKFEQYYFIANNKAYVLTLTTDVLKFELFKPVGEQILDSFVLK
ncbi:MAG: hypothetical protein ABJB86_18135 [Bacteroidota bacterium]